MSGSRTSGQVFERRLGRLLIAITYVAVVLLTIGVFLGASVGSRVAHQIELRFLNLLFVGVLLFTSLQMLLKALG